MRANEAGITITTNDHTNKKAGKSPNAVPRYSYSPFKLMQNGFNRNKHKMALIVI